jgi:hypothetical protein
VKKIKLTQDKYTLVDDEDYEELNKHKWCAVKNGYNYYATRVKDRKTIWMHRVIMNPPPHLDIDHKNNNGLDNRKEKLRVCTRSQNSANRRLGKNNTSGIKGIHWEGDRKKWRARICVDGKARHIGRYSTREEAQEAYCEIAKEYFGEFYSDGVIK